MCLAYIINLLLKVTMIIIQVMVLIMMEALTVWTGRRNLIRKDNMIIHLTQRIMRMRMLILKNY